MSAAQATSASSNTVYHDTTTRADDMVHKDVHAAVKKGGTLPSSLSGMPALVPGKVSDQKPGQLSSGESADGGTTVYFGAYSTDEDLQAVENSNGEVMFFFEEGDEGALLRHLKLAGLIPENIQSFSSLGDRAIGVIENAVDEGVLTVAPGGKLTKGSSDVPEDEMTEQSSTANQGANRQSNINDDGGIDDEVENPDAKPKAERESTTGASTQTASDGASEGSSSTGAGTATTGSSSTGAGGATGGASSTGSASGSGGSTAATAESESEGTATTAGVTSEEDATTVAKPGEMRGGVEPSSVEMKGDAVGIAGGGKLHESNDGKFYVSGMSQIPEGQMLEISEGALSAAGLTSPSKVAVAMAFSDGRLGVVWPRDGSGKPAVVGVSEKVKEGLGEEDSKGPSALDKAYGDNRLEVSFSTGVGVLPGEAGSSEDSTLNPTSGRDLVERDGKFYLSNGNQAEDLEIMEGAVDASGLKDGFNYMDVRSAMSAGRLVVVNIDGKEQVVGISAKQQEMIGEHTGGKKGAAGVEAAYEMGVLAYGPHGGLAVKHPGDPSQTMRHWGSVKTDALGDDFEFNPTTVGEVAPIGDGEVRVTQNDDGGFNVQLNDQPPVTINEPSMKAMGFSENTPLKSISDAFKDGRLGVVNGEVRVMKAEVSGKPGWTVVGDENNGYTVTGEGGSFVGSISADEAGALGLPGNNAYTVANHVASTDASFQNGRMIAGTGSGDPSAPQSTRMPDNTSSIAYDSETSSWQVVPDNPRYAPINVPSEYLDIVGVPANDHSASKIAAKFASGDLVFQDGQVRVAKLTVNDGNHNVTISERDSSDRFGNGFNIAVERQPQTDRWLRSEVYEAAGLNADSTAADVAAKIKSGEIWWNEGTGEWEHNPNAVPNNG